jgi:hypothetical protein
MLSVAPKEPSGRPLPVALPTEPHADASLPVLNPHPSLTVDVQLGAQPTRGLWWSTPALLCFFLVLCALAIVLRSLGAPSPIVASLGIAGAVVFGLTVLVALCRALLGLVDLVRAARGRGSEEVARTTAALLGNLVMVGFGMLVAYFATVGFARGRQLRRLGKVLLPDLRSDPGWAMSPLALDGAEDPPAGLADQWRENGRTEHASVAAFARVTLDLMALGAPPHLIAAANQDALDEIRHTELCFSLAYALDGKRVSPGPFPQAQRVPTLPRSRTLALAKLGVDSLIDGALHEGVSARIIAKLARRSDVPAIRAALKSIAADEGRHAAHGWAVAEWCLAEGGIAVGQAFLGAIRMLPRQMHSQLPEPAADGGWERWGIHGNGLEAQEYLATRAHLIERVHALAAKPTSEGA